MAVLLNSEHHAASVEINGSSKLQVMLDPEPGRRWRLAFCGGIRQAATQYDFLSSSVSISYTPVYTVRRNISREESQCALCISCVADLQDQLQTARDWWSK